jgi:hypothetical protein
VTSTSVAVFAGAVAFVDGFRTGPGFSVAVFAGLGVTFVGLDVTFVGLGVTFAAAAGFAVVVLVAGVARFDAVLAAGRAAGGSGLA